MQFMLLYHYKKVSSPRIVDCNFLLVINTKAADIKMELQKHSTPAWIIAFKFNKKLSESKIAALPLEI
jgi:hypothetical protein